MDLWKCAIVRNLFEKKTKHLALAFLKKKKRKKKYWPSYTMNGLLNFKWNNGKVLFLKQLFSFCFHWNNSTFEYRFAMNMNLQRHFVCRILENVQLHLQKSFISISLEKILYRAVLLQADFEWCVAYWFGSTLKQCKHFVWHTSKFEQTFDLHFLENIDKVLC